MLKNSFNFSFLFPIDKNLLSNFGVMIIYNGFYIIWSLSGNRTYNENIKDWLSNGNINGYFWGPEAKVINCVKSLSKSTL